QLLSLEKLSREHPTSKPTSLIGRSFRANTGASGSLLGSSPLSSSLSSLTSTGATTTSTQLTHWQLADQIRNDLLVSFQLFRQNHFSAGHFEIPASNAQIAAQLLDRIMIFDSTSNATASLASSSTVSLLSNSSNPLISST